MEKEVEKVISEYNIEPNIYDDSNTIEDILLDIQTVSMFNPVKLIVLKNISALKDKKEAKLFLDTVKIIDNSIIIVFALETEKIDKTNPLISFLFSVTKPIQVKKLSEREVIQFIKQTTKEKNGSITNSAAIKLSGKLPLNVRIIVNEIDKLLSQNAEITDAMIESSINSYYKDDFFALSNALTNRDVYELLKSYKGKIRINNEPGEIIGQIAKTLELSVVVNAFKEQGFSLSDISAELGIHIFRVKRANDLLISSTPQKIENQLIKLFELDKGIKTGLLDPQFGLDKFILDIVR